MKSGRIENVIGEDLLNLQVLLMHYDFFFFLESRCSLGDGVEESAQLKQLTILIMHPFSHLFSGCLFRANCM